ncbi:MAG: hypothetical protein LW822_03300 [Phycisphaeraceae bacterium]|nr:hypothetical protein [Phycisphaeraceae bacterium]
MLHWRRQTQQRQQPSMPGSKGAIFVPGQSGGRPAAGPGPSTRAIGKSLADKAVKGG